jgi:hypothetical protein
MRSILSLIIIILILLSVAFLLWRKRTRNLALISAKLDSYWNTLKERRKFKRFKRQLNVECSVLEKAGNIYHAFSQDISGEGICLQVPEIMPEKSLVGLEIEIPDKRPIVVKGEVVWVSEMKRDFSASERIFKIGVRFLKIDIKDKDLLSEFLNRITENDA